MRDPASDMLIGQVVDGLFRAAVLERVTVDDPAAVYRCLVDAGFSARDVAAFEGDVLARASARLQRRRYIRDVGRAAGDALLGLIVILMILALAVPQLLAPARAGDALVTDMALAGLAPWAPLIIAVLLLLCWLWRERRRAAVDGGDDDTATPGPRAPNLASSEGSIGDAENNTRTR